MDIIGGLIQGLLDFILGPVQALIAWAVNAIAGLFFMLIGGIFDLLLGVLGFVISLLPDVPNLGLSNASGILVGYAWLNSWLPVSETLTAISVIVGVMVLIFGFRVVVKIWEWFPFKFS